MLAVMAVDLLPERRCDTCTAIQKDQWGCEKKARLPLKFDGKVIDRCPRRPILEEPDFYSELFSLYRGYQNGFLPEEGGLASQPNLLVESFKYMDVALDRCETARREKEAKDRSRPTK